MTEKKVIATGSSRPTNALVNLERDTNRDLYSFSIEKNVSNGIEKYEARQLTANASAETTHVRANVCVT